MYSLTDSRVLLADLWWKLSRSRPESKITTPEVSQPSPLSGNIGAAAVTRSPLHQSSLRRAITWGRSLQRHLQHGLSSIAEQPALTPNTRLQHQHSSHFMQTCFGRWTRPPEAAARQDSSGGTNTASAQRSSCRGSSRTHICTQADGRAEAK